MASIQLGGKDFVVDELPFYALKKFIPLANKSTKALQILDGISEEDFDCLLEAVYVGIEPFNKITLDELGKLSIKLSEFPLAITAIVSACGLAAKSGEQQAAS